MENKVTEAMEEGLNTETGKVNRAPKLVILGGLATVGALLFKFRNKINTKIEGAMVKKLTKKGYEILAPKVVEVPVEQIFDTETL